MSNIPTTERTSPLSETVPGDRQGLNATDRIRLRVSLTDITLDYEGSGAFLRDNLNAILQGLLQLPTREARTNSEDDSTDAPRTETAPAGTAIQHTTNSIASRLSVATGPDLIVAAAMKLTFVDGRDTMSRNELSTEMRSATAFFKRSYANNLSAYLTRLEKTDRLRRQGTNTFALAPEEREKAKHVLGSDHE